MLQKAMKAAQIKNNPELNTIWETKESEPLLLRIEALGNQIWSGIYGF
jgi:hypothetical protein